MDLILARCGKNPALFGDVQSLTEHDRCLLLDSGRGRAALTQPLSGRRIAVGRREGVRCTWWLTPPGFLLEPPVALWLEPALFQATSGGTMPHTLDVVALWRTLPDADQGAWVLGAVIEALRAGEQVCVDIEQSTGESLGILLAWILGSEVERVNGKRTPWSQSVGALGYTADVNWAGDQGRRIDAAAPPPVNDPVGRCILDHWAADPLAFDIPGGITASWVSNRNREHRGSDLAALLGAQASLEQVGEALVQHTIATGDPTPWIALQRRASVVRQAAVARILDAADQLNPSPQLVAALDAIYPRGAPLAPWCAALLEWLRRTNEPEHVLDTLSDALIEWPHVAPSLTRSSLWTEAIRILVSRGWLGLARTALRGPVAQQILRDGSGSALATMWASLPRGERDSSTLDALVTSFARVPDGDAAAAVLFRHVIDNEAEVVALFELWFAHRGDAAVHIKDRLRHTVWDSVHRETWLMRAVVFFGAEPVQALLADAGPADAVWVEFEAACGVGRSALARVRHMQHLEQGRLALVPVARGLLPDALHTARFPDLELATVASSFLIVPGASAIWAWLAVASAPPGAYPDAMIDGTVVDLCAAPPRGRARTLCFQIMDRLAVAKEWTPLDHARWVVRFALAPDVDHSGFHEQMATRLVHGLGRRRDAPTHLASVVKEMMQLDPSHPALQGLFLRWLPGVWPQPPEAFIEAIETSGVPQWLQPAWRALAHR